MAGELHGFLVRVRTPDGRVLDGVAFSASQKDAEERAARVWTREGYEIVSVTKLSKATSEHLRRTGRLQSVVRRSGRRNPKRKVSKRAARFIGRKIRTLAHEGMQAPRRVAAAYSLARRAGFKMPHKNPVGVSESVLWRAVKTDANRIRKVASGQVGGSIELLVKELERTADVALLQLSRGFHKNPTLAVLGNPRFSKAGVYPALPVAGTLSHRLYEIRYKHASDGKDYRHPFGPGATIKLLRDGSILITAKHRLWEDL